MLKTILVSAPPMAKNIERFSDLATQMGFQLIASEADQAMTEADLRARLPEFDGWIIGDDPANETVLRAGVAGRLRAAVRWGIGMDNVDSAAARSVGLEIENTPSVFGEEVADVALGYVIGLARRLFSVDRAVRLGAWPKPTGRSLRGKQALVVGYGDVGRALVQRLQVLGVEVAVADPYADPTTFPDGVAQVRWPDKLSDADFLILCCPLTAETLRLVNTETLGRMKRGCGIVNVSRGALIDERALIHSIQSEHVDSVALDVFEDEPLPMDSGLRRFDCVAMGCHNSSNTIEAIERASEKALRILGRKFEPNPKK